MEVPTINPYKTTGLVVSHMQGFLLQNIALVSRADPDRIVQITISVTKPEKDH